MLAPPSPSPQRRSQICALLPALLLFLSETSELLLVSPRIRLLESLLCRAHYANDPSITPPIPEDLCKIPAVQTRLAHIRGWQVFWEAIPIMSLAIPWGILADRIGRKKVLAVNFIGCMVHIIWFLVVCHPRSRMPAEAIWGSAAAFVLGGGPRTGGILILALVTDASREEKRSERFYFTYSAFLVTELLAPPVAGLLMRWSVWACFVVALGSLVCALVVLSLVPAKTTGKEMRDEGEAADGLLADTGRASPKPHEQGRDGFVKRVVGKVLQFDKNILIVLTGHFICPVRQELVFQIMIPYASTLFSLPIAKAGLFLSLVAATNLFIFVTFLPYLTRRLSHYFTPPRIDSLCARLSCVLLALGSLATGFSVNIAWFTTAIVVFAAGFGVRLTLLSLLTSLVDKEKVGRVYTMVTVCEGFGEMVSAPVLQEAWAWGLKTGGGWRGAPWCIGAVVYLGAAWGIGRAKV